MAAVNNNTSLQPTTTESTTTRTSSPPWTQIVRGAEPEPKPEPEKVAAPAENVEKPPVVAWNKKPMSTGESSSVNGGAVGKGGSESGGGAVVMGAERWPSLSECTTKGSPKVIVNELSSTTVLSPVRSPSSPFQKTTTSNSNHHANSNHSRPARQKSGKRDGGNNPQANGASPHQSSQVAGEGAHSHHNHGSPIPISNENSGRDNVQNHNHRESGQRNSGGEHPHQRNQFRRGNGGSHSRGDGSHQTYGGRRNEQERGNHDLNHQRSFNGRDSSMQPRGDPRSFVRSPQGPQPVTAPFVFAPPPPIPFINPIMPIYLPPGLQFGPPPPIYFTTPSAELYAELMTQINFYFSNDNLARDTFLRGQMDENGWVSVDLIAEFNRVKSLTNDPYHILEAVRHSSVVEVQGDKMRRRDDWSRWLLPPTVQFPTSLGFQSPNGTSVSSVSDHIQSVSLDDKINYPSNGHSQVDASGSPSKVSSGDSSNVSKKIVDEANSSGC